MSQDLWSTASSFTSRQWLFFTTLKKQDTTPKNVKICNKTEAHLSPQHWKKFLVCLPTAGQGHRVWEDMLGILAAAHMGKQFRTDGQGSQPPAMDLARDFGANLCASLGHTSFPLILTPSHSPHKLMTMKRWHWLGLQPMSPGRAGWTTEFASFIWVGSGMPGLLIWIPLIYL